MAPPERYPGARRFGLRFVAAAIGLIGVVVIINIISWLRA